MPGEFGALLEEALGRGPGHLAPPGPLPSAAEALDSPEDLDDSLVVAVSARATTADAGSMADIPPDFELTPTFDIIAAAATPPLVVANGVDIQHNGTQHTGAPTTGAPPGVGASPTAETSDLATTAEAAAPAGTTDPGALDAPRPTTVEGRVELDPAWVDRPLLEQPVILKPGASVGPPDGGSYIANPGSIAVTFVPSGTSGRSAGAGTYFVDPADVAAAAGPDGVVTDQLMAQLSGHPYEAGPPTGIQMAIIDAARRAGLRFGASA